MPRVERIFLSAAFDFAFDSDPRILFREHSKLKLRPVETFRRRRSLLSSQRSLSFLRIGSELARR